MRRFALATATFSLLYLSNTLDPRLAAAPMAGAAPITWSGGPFLAPNPVDCAVAEQTCDHFVFTVAPGTGDTVLTARVVARSTADDLDLFLRDADGNTVGRSTSETGSEEIVLPNPPAGTYTVVVQPYLVLPGSGTYDGVIGVANAPTDEQSKAYHGAIYTADFVGIPESRPARMTTQKLEVSFTSVGRQAAEPTIGVNGSNVAFFAASTFDFPTPGAPARLARTLVMRSTDKGRSWQAVSPAFNLSDESLTEPAFSLDPMIYVDPATGRVFSIDLYAGCAYAIFSDDNGVTWQRSPLSCGEPVNDHHTIVAARPRMGLATNGYPNLIYYCFNRVGDSACGRSHDGGRTWVPAGEPAYTGIDPAVAGNPCGGLHGHLAADAYGDVFLPKGHCDLPWVAITENAGESWLRTNITNRTPMADHEVSLAVDTANNIYAVWADRNFRLPFLAVSRDHGRSWSTPIMIAPPGVHEVNFPTIAAGDPGRIAVLFPGTESQVRTDATRPWNVYLVASIDALAADPTFTWTIGNPKGDPVHRGSCGPDRCDAEDNGSMFDFLDIQVSPADGAFWGTASDTCVGACITDAAAKKLRPGQGVAIREVKGPSLFAKK